MDVKLGGRTDIDVLYTKEAADMLHILRQQIEIAQGRSEGAAA